MSSNICYVLILDISGKLYTLTEKTNMLSSYSSYIQIPLILKAIF